MCNKAWGLGLCVGVSLALVITGACWLVFESTSSKSNAKTRTEKHDKPPVEGERTSYVNASWTRAVRNAANASGLSARSCRAPENVPFEAHVWQNVMIHSGYAVDEGNSYETPLDEIARWSSALLRRASQDEDVSEAITSVAISLSLSFEQNQNESYCNTVVERVYEAYGFQSPPSPYTSPYWLGKRGVCSSPGKAYVPIFQNLACAPKDGDISHIGEGVVLCDDRCLSTISRLTRSNVRPSGAIVWIGVHGTFSPETVQLIPPAEVDRTVCETESGCTTKCIDCRSLRGP